MSDIRQFVEEVMVPTFAAVTAKHTPGPWIWSKSGYSLHVVNPRPNGFVTILDVEHWGRVSSNEKHDFRALEAECDATRSLIAAAPELFAVLDELDGDFDRQLYQERSRDQLDAPDDREYSVNITAKQLRAIASAVLNATRRNELEADNCLPQATCEDCSMPSGDHAVHCPQKHGITSP